MKKILIAVASVVLLSSCGVGSYTVSSGKSDECAISFTTPKEAPITVSIDDKTYDIKSVKDKAWKTDRKIKKTAQNTIRLAPGAHSVKVVSGGTEVYSKQLFISASEHKVIEL